MNNTISLILIKTTDGIIAVIQDDKTERVICGMVEKNLRHYLDTKAVSGTKKGVTISRNSLIFLVAGTGFEPATFGL